MNKFCIWVDADSCPAKAKTIILKNAIRLNIEVIYVANRKIPFSMESSLFKMIVTENSEGSADNYIVENVCENDVVITRDIPLAARLLNKNITVLNDRGIIFDDNNVESMLKQRELSLQMRQLGIHTGSSLGSYGPEDVHKFASCLDKTLALKQKESH